MANWISGEDDMLIDFDRIDADTQGKVTPSVADSIRHMASMDLDEATIAQFLCLEVKQVEEVLRENLFA
ncbi:hypothetical protein O9X98_09720 [Agrobacterium salinitolerans]|nr:hypothetical protein [Agrobacterium salinitolerans]